MFEGNVDAGLRRYLERPPPRPPLVDARYDDRRARWLFPLGAVLTGGLITVPIMADHPDHRVIAVVVWAGFVLAVVIVGFVVHALTQSLFRHGTLATATVVARRVEIDGEDRTLEVSLAVEVPGAGGATDYRAAPSPLRRSFRVTLGDRWLGGKDHAPFLHGATFPILIGKGKAAKLFVQHEALDAGEVTD